MFLCLFNTILFNSYTMASDSEGSPKSEVQHKNCKKIVADAPDEDFLYPMFEHATLDEMLQYANNPRVSGFVKKHVFPVKYRNYHIKLITHVFLQRQPNFEEFSDSLMTYGYEFSLDIIKQFGESISKLSYGDDHLSADQAAVLHSSVNECGSQALTQLELSKIRDNTLAQFKKPFSKLNTLHLPITSNQIGPFMPLNELFPQLHRLRLEFSEIGQYSFEDISFLDCELPNMKHLEIRSDVRKHFLPAIYKQIEQLLKKNPQVRTLFYTYDLDDFIQVINGRLPNLEHLIVTTLHPEIDYTRLDRVKCLTVQTDETSPFDRISFSSLESLSLRYSERHETGYPRSSWMRFFQNHQGIKKLNCSVSTDKGFVEFLSPLTHLEEIQIDYYPNFNIDLVSRLIENHKSLSKFQYKVSARYQREEPNLEDYRELFGNEWLISYSAENFLILSFERKN